MRPFISFSSITYHFIAQQSFTSVYIQCIRYTRTFSIINGKHHTCIAHIRKIAKDLRRRGRGRSLHSTGTTLTFSSLTPMMSCADSSQLELSSRYGNQQPKDKEMLLAGKIETHVLNLSNDACGAITLLYIL